MAQGKGTFINEVAKDRLWRDYVSREENHQTYWAGEAQFVKGSLSPEKKNILKSVDVGGDIDSAILLGTARGNGSLTSPKSQRGGSLGGTTSSSAGSPTSGSKNPNAPSNLLLRQLHMTAIENGQAEAKQLETLQNYKLNYSSRAMQGNTSSEGKALPPMSPTNNNRHTPISPNATLGGTGRVGSFTDKERTLNNCYCSYYAGRDIGIHHYQYSPPARSCQGLNDAIENDCANPPTPYHAQFNSTTSSALNASATAPATRPNNLPPLQTHLIARGDHSISQPLSPLSASRVYAEKIEDHCRVVSPKRHFTEHGLLSPHMGKRVASATGKRGYGQRIASTNGESFVVRPSVELNEGSKHGYKKW